jgi:hypothetical protein
VERGAGTSERRLMSAGEIAVHLLVRCPSLEYFEAYMFGSTLSGVGEDIDILIVGPGGDLLSQLKQELVAAGECLPLHVLYLQSSEVRSVEFVAKEKCVLLAELASFAGE